MQWLSEQADSSPSNVHKQVKTQEPGFPVSPLVLAGQISAEFHLPQNWEPKPWFDAFSLGSTNNFIGTPLKTKMTLENPHVQ